MARQIRISPITRLEGHGTIDIVLSGPALERINESALKEVLISNTIPAEAKARECPRLRIISVAKLLAEAIHRIHGDESVSSLFV